VIASLHDVGIIHRDLNPTNVMLDAEGHLVLMNFDCAEFFPASANTRGTTSAAAFERGLTQYQAPEILLGWAHNFAVYCWSFGMKLLYFLFFGTVSDVRCLD
jgi:serine/threonine protein kinase